MYVLVKFKDNPVPAVFPVEHVSYGAHLATMNGVEWASPVISGNGDALGSYEPRPGYYNAGSTGGVYKEGFLHDPRITAYKPVKKADDA